MLNLLDTIITLWPSNFGEGLNWIGVVIQAIITFAGSMGLGIILFTVILKLITLPLDIYSKAKMRKNTLVMEKMRPQLEKLQKQYQNDPNAYNAKMMELYKKNNYSMLGACLPMIVTLIIFMVVLGAFSGYSQYTNVDLYRQMTASYTGAVTQYQPDCYAKGEPSRSDEVTVNEENGKYIYSRTEYYEGEYAQGKESLVTIKVVKTIESDTKLNEAKIDWNGDNVKAGTPEYTIKTAAVYASGETAVKEALEAAKAANEGASEDVIAKEAMMRLGRDAAEETYNSKRMSFLWVKNIWLPDVSYRHPVQYEEELPNEELYEEITYNLKDAKNEANGYYILIVISVGTMFLSQFITSKSQKAQSELQTADGRGKTTQRVMMVVMPIMFGVFSFFYSAAFSIYMITGNIFSILSTVLTNFFIDKKFNKMQEKEIQEKYNKRIPQAAKQTDGGKSGGKQK